MNVEDREHFKRHGLSSKEIDMLDICLGQCAGCLNHGECNIQNVLLRDDSPTRETLKG